ncbi:aldo/keto reductase [Nesterenkonia jeotgali]|uniref:Aldo/keto reductase n=1 Tax=Nesterenkonia jeotgali TaxID=317018 RepID=A0A0W8IDF9_9MICC|nr:aldo/keto reductase [Nesterenkonia jeotgali]KUG57970.1 aldo/keto reductase [Nesterenkonia jeotgali]MBA8920728.1 aryl-alcohol dehydrogenase-like predicted oxidoreductase [Nesterenkonia jeotgali]
MQHRVLGRTGREVSTVGLGTWQFGGDFGRVEESDAFAVMDAAAEHGVTVFDTADVYGDGLSEQLIGRWLAKNPEWQGLVATKMIRRAEEPSLAHATAENFQAWIDRSRKNLGVDTLDLVQLHCPDDDVYASDAVFDRLDALVESGAIAHYGVSVETVEQALSAIARPNVATVQIILNAFRQKPLEKVLPAAQEAGVGIIARVPLASGLLSGRYTKDTTFEATDHRSYNRAGEAFDVGETFSGVDFATGVEGAAQFSELAEQEGLKPTTAALAWVIQSAGVSTVIPGARNADQARGNAEAGGAPQLSDDFRSAVRKLYADEIAPSVHDRW